MFIETSAKDGDNVKKLFREVATNLPGSETQTKEKQLVSYFNPFFF